MSGFLDIPGAKANDVASKAPINSPAFTGTPTGITKAHVGLSNVDNTADANKPVSTAQQAAINAVSPATTLVEGVPVTVYGNSYTVSPPLSGRANLDHPTRAANRLRMGTATKNGVGGSVANHVFFDANSNVSGAAPSHQWVPGNNKGLVIFEETINDVVTFGSSAAAQDNYREALRGLVELWRTGTRVPATDASITYAGTWGVGVTGYHQGGGKRATASGSTATFTFTGTEIVVWINTSGSGTTPSVTIKEGTTTLATVTTTGRMQPYDAPGVVGTSTSVGACAIRIKNLTAGSHTFVLTTSGTGSLFFDGYSLPATKPPQIIFVKEGAISSYAPNGSAALHATYNQILLDVAAEYPSIVTVADPGANWDSSCLYMGDGTGNHPNDKGHAVLADAVVAAVKTLGYKDGMHIL